MHELIQGRKIAIRQLLYEIALIMYVYSRMIGNTTLAEIGETFILIKLLQYGTLMAVMAVFFLCRKYKKKQLVMIALTFGLAMITWYNSKSIDVLYTVLFMITVRDIDIDKLFRDIFWFILFFYLLTIILSMTGIITNLVFSDITRVRKCLGFGHPNYLGQYTMVLTLLWIYRRYDKFGIFDVAGLLVFNIVISKIADSRSGFYSCIIAILITALMKIMFRNKKKSPSVLYISLLLMPVLIIASLYLSFHYREMGVLGLGINNLFSGRLSLQEKAVTQFGFSLLGQKMEFMSGYNGFGGNIMDVYYYIDSSYIRMLVYFGLVVSALLIVMYEYAIYTSIKTKEYSILIVLLVYVIYGFIQPTVFSIHYNVALVYVGACFFSGLFEKRVASHPSLIKMMTVNKELK